MEVQFEDLDKSDLFIDCIYKGGKIPKYVVRAIS